MEFLKLIFEFKSFKTIKKRIKRGFIFAQDHMDATWHARPRGRVT